MIWNPKDTDIVKYSSWQLIGLHGYEKCNGLLVKVLG